MYQIQKNVPMPAAVSGSSTGQPKYNWDRMEVGDSIFVPESEIEEGKDLKALRQRVYQSARAHGAKTGKKFLALVVEESQPNPKYVQPGNGVEDNGEAVNILVKGVRCWLQSVEMPEETKPAEETHVEAEERAA